jgi:AcrR family transcriptional regulator
MASTTPTRTERQRLRTRRQLLDAGRSLIAAKGVAGLRIQEITEHAESIVQSAVQRSQV